MNLFKLVAVFVAAMFVIVPCLFVAGCIWNVKLYRDCRADGHASYECSAMINSRSQGVVVDDLNK